MRWEQTKPDPRPTPVNEGQTAQCCDERRHHLRAMKIDGVFLLIDIINQLLTSRPPSRRSHGREIVHDTVTHDVYFGTPVSYKDGDYDAAMLRREPRRERKKPAIERC
jgi:hypothetical protein